VYRIILGEKVHTLEGIQEKLVGTYILTATLNTSTNALLTIKIIKNNSKLPALNVQHNYIEKQLIKHIYRSLSEI